ncbi:hypothetical protein JZO67_000162 [Enterococcus sp. 665A]|uniref:Uncharacterized protein n=1 Tax=Candidatus Enterococcus ferrettii TaxID=2815324 RepID=A0ABV0EKB1_9ENTE
MNPIFQYEQGYISFAELKLDLWDFGPNAIFEVGEDCFRFYIDKASNRHSLDYHIEEWSLWNQRLE